MKNSHKFIWYNEKEYPLDILFDLKFSKIPYQNLFTRYKRKNKNMDIILNKPKQNRDMTPYVYKGKQYHFHELSNLKECKVKSSALWVRLKKLSPEQALTISYKKYYTYFGKQYLYKDLIQLKEFNVTRDAFYKRIQHGWGVEESILVPMCSWSRANKKLQYQVSVLRILFYFLLKTSKN